MPIEERERLGATIYDTSKIKLRKKERKFIPKHDTPNFWKLQAPSRWRSIAGVPSGMALHSQHARVHTDFLFWKTKLIHNKPFFTENPAKIFSRKNTSKENQRTLATWRVLVLPGFPCQIWSLIKIVYRIFDVMVRTKCCVVLVRAVLCVVLVCQVFWCAVRTGRRIPRIWGKKKAVYCCALPVVTCENWWCPACYFWTHSLTAHVFFCVWICTLK